MRAMSMGLIMRMRRRRRGYRRERERGNKKRKRDSLFLMTCRSIHLLLNTARKHCNICVPLSPHLKLSPSSSPPPSFIHSEVDIHVSSSPGANFTCLWHFLYIRCSYSLNWIIDSHNREGSESKMW